MSAARWAELEGKGFVNLERITTLKPVQEGAGWMLEARGWSFCERLAEKYRTASEADAAAAGLVGYR